MAVTFDQLIAENKRNSFFLAAIMFALIACIAFVFGLAFGDGNWQAGLIPSAIAAVVAIVLILSSYYGGSSVILGVSHARPIEKKDDPQLYNVVEEMAIAGGIPTPKIYLIDDSAPNAFATGRDPQHAVVAITTGLRDKLNRDELQAVMAHELSHVRNYDIRFAMLMAVLVGMIVLLCDLFRRWVFYSSLTGGRRSSRSRSRGGGGAMIIVFIIALVLSLLAPLLAKIIQLAVSRQREYLADASAVDLTRNPDGLASALAKISADPEVLEAANRATQHLYIVNPIMKVKGDRQSMFSTHPPLKERIQRILALKQA
jgi:heat shock protein HtpX